MHPLQDPVPLYLLFLLHLFLPSPIQAGSEVCWGAAELGKILEDTFSWTACDKPGFPGNNIGKFANQAAAISADLSNEGQCSVHDRDGGFLQNI